MKCNVCGRHTNNEEANFCEYCGSPYREHMKAYYDMQQQNNAQNQYYYQNYQQANYQQANYQQENKPVSFLDFLASYGLFFIPFVGWLVFIIMLFVWAFSKNTPVSKKNWARATLIFGAVIFVIMVLYTIYIISSPIYQDILKGTFNYYSYIESLR